MKHPRERVLASPSNSQTDGAAYCIGAIKRCTSFVCPSFGLVHTIYSKSESGRNFKFVGDITQETSNLGELNDLGANSERNYIVTE